MITDFTIYVFQASHDHPRKWVVLFRLLIKALSVTDSAIENLLVLQSINVLGSMWINVLKAFGKFVIEPINEADDRSSDSDNTVLFALRSALYKLVVVFCRFLNRIRPVRSYNGNQLVDLALCR